jgi:methyltransferase (TIGR00027 family)
MWWRARLAGWQGPTPLFSNVSDTARWVAVYRATESARPDALFHDPLAGQLAGQRGRTIVAAAPRMIRNGWWLVARTKIIDDIIAEAINAGCDRVLNLAAGLDTRPYGLDLPPDFTWVEADLPQLLAEKERLLADETP